MKIKTNNGVKDSTEIFPNLQTFKNHVSKLIKNIRFDNERINNETERVMFTLKEQEGTIRLSSLQGWLVKTYGFKTKKFGHIEYWIERGWSQEDAMLELEKRGQEIKKRNRLCVEYWINKGYSKESAINEISKQQQMSSKCVKTRLGKSKKNLYEKGYSEEEIKKLCLTPVHVNFWVNKGYTEEESKKIVSEHQRNASKNVNYKHRLTTNNILYWVNKGYTEEESKKIISERQSTFSLAKCIEKYGEVEGKERFINRQNTWQKTLYKNGKLKSGFSEISQELFFKLIEEFEIDELNYILFAKKGGEFVLQDGHGFYRYDFTDLKNKKIIEYNGDKYHANPDIYKADDNPNPFRTNLTAKEIWFKDSHKKNLAEEKGFQVLVVWDSEYRWGDKQKIINQCKNFLKNK